MAAAVFGFVGVLLGTLSTSMLTIYRERLVSTREVTAFERRHALDRKSAHDAFQRESILALQSAVADLIKAAYEELDRVLAEFSRTGQWAGRQWETPTAVGWSAAILSLESSRARVFDEELRSLANNLRTVAGESVWAQDLESAKQTSRTIEPLLDQFHTVVNRILPTLY